MGITIFTFRVGRYYRRLYGRKLHFTASLTRRRKKNFFDHITDDIPPQIKILNTVILLFNDAVIWIWIEPRHEKNMSQGLRAGKTDQDSNLPAQHFIKPKTLTLYISPYSPGSPPSHPYPPMQTSAVLFS